MSSVADRHGGVLRAWLEERREALDPFRRPCGIEDDRRLMRILFDAGWSRWGWPEQAGGLGGSAVLRAVLYDELAAAGVRIPEPFVLLETLGPVLTRYAPELAGRHLTDYLSGERLWGQGFSEAEAGSDLASVRTRARQDGDGFVLNGHKLWTTLGQFARWAAVLARTGALDSGHRGLSLLWVDLTAPGVTVRPIRAANGRDEFAEMYFDDVRVPAGHLIGGVDEGWAVAMYLLQFERGTYAWLRQAVLHHRIGTIAATAPEGAGRTRLASLGRAHLAATALRAKSRGTVHRLAAGLNPGPLISVDKLLLSRAEHAVFDAARRLRWADLALSDDEEAAALRAEWFCSRASSIFGGAAEVQRDIVADHVLALPKGDRRGR
ncbi:acyl-CoA dehydrogenase family protein [Actinomadura vinacea]|uniref:Acyl-CoA dehydrogenase family protein n=1 Tax=Actinomadura vinacea TaxID=115336 RepID=A0ABN3IHM4_9ACTN